MEDICSTTAVNDVESGRLLVSDGTVATNGMDTDDES